MLRDPAEQARITVHLPSSNHPPLLQSTPPMEGTPDFDFSDVVNGDFDRFWEPHSQSITMSYIERKAWDLNTRMLAEEAKALSESVRLLSPSQEHSVR
jgi:hypothetical protein